MAEEHKWLTDFDFNFSSEEEIPHNVSVGWQHLKTSDFGIDDVDQFNSAVPLRFGLSDAGGHLKLSENYIMIRPKDLTEKIERARSRAAQAQFKQEAESRLYVDSADPRGSELAKNKDLVHADLTMTTINPTSAKPKRGRPRKNA